MSKYETYTVEQGDILATIAKKLNVEVVELIRFNGLDIYHPHIIYVGQKLKVPRKKKCRRTY